jgi:hypothetical protein
MALFKDVDLDYRGTVETESRERLGFEIPNSTLEHAVLVQTRLIDSTRNRLSIMTSAPCELEYEPIISSIASLAERLTARKDRRIPFYSFFSRFKKKTDNLPDEIRILFSDDSGDYKGNFYDFVKMYEGIIKIRKFKNPNPNTPHFLVSDSVRYRAEKEHNKEDLVDYKINATANFNDKSKASMLQNFFDICWKRDDKLVAVQ